MIKSIQNYIEDNISKQAILLNGNWGTGKTFFVQNELMNELKKQNRLVLYFSLFSFYSIKELNQKLYLSTLLKHTDLIKEHWSESITLVIFNILSMIASSNNINADCLYGVETFLKLDNMVIILDDLERSNIELKDVLGWISNLTENYKNTKVIVIADEKKLLTDDESKKEIYKLYKEKIFGPTIEYRLNIKKVLDNIIATLPQSTEEAKDFLSNKKEIILRCIKQKNEINIRTLVFAISAFTIFYKELKRLEESNSLKDLKDSFKSSVDFVDNEAIDILKYTIYASIEIRENYKLPFRLTNSNCEQIWLGDNINGQFLWSYKFVDEFISKYKLTKDFDDIIYESISKKISILEKTDCALEPLFYWRDLEDEEINNFLNKLSLELQENKYSKNDFSRIILVLMSLKNSGFNINYNKYTHYILEYAKKNDLSRKDLGLAFYEQEDLKKYEDIIKDILIFIDQKKETEAINDNSFLSQKEFWKEDFEEKCFAKQSNFLKSKKFFAYINPDSLIYSIKHSKTRELRYFIKGITIVYSFSNLNDYYKLDITNLEKVIESLKSSDYSKKGVTWNLAKEELLLLLQNSLAQIKNDNKKN